MIALRITGVCAVVLRVEALLEFVGRHVDVAENLAERANGQRAVAMHGHDGVALATCQDVVTAANAYNGESLTLKKTQHILAADATELSHE
jgi:hypothetical protein